MNTKVLVVTRLFSGLHQSVVEEKWHPTGIPAMYRFIEGLSEHKIPTVVLFLCKTAIESRAIHERRIFTYDDEQVHGIIFHVVPFRSLPIRSTKLNAMWNGWKQWRYCINVLKEHDPDVIYCDRSHVIFGAAARLWFRKRVVLRLLGFYPDMKKLFTAMTQRFLFPLVYCAYFAPFYRIICTQDDSGGAFYLAKMPNKKVPKKLLVNGVDYRISTINELNALRRQHHLVYNWPIFLYVGKLEESKGCLEFIETMGCLYASKKKFYALMIGAGPLSDEVKKRIEERGMGEAVQYIGAVENKKMYHYYNLVDVYVHLYVWASLTNTVLEAMRAGNALLLLSSSRETHVGEYTDAFIPGNCKVIFDRNNIVASLVEIVNDLLRYPQKIATLKKNMRMFSERSLRNWHDRIKEEFRYIGLKT